VPGDRPLTTLLVTPAPDTVTDSVMFVGFVPQEILNPLMSVKGVPSVLNCGTDHDTDAE
jgi:hypothetical protein